MKPQPLHELAATGFMLIRTLLRERPQTQDNIDCAEALAEALHNFPDDTDNPTPWELTQKYLSAFLTRYPEFAHYPAFRDAVKSREKRRENK